MKQNKQLIPSVYAEIKKFMKKMQKKIKYFF